MVEPVIDIVTAAMKFATVQHSGQTRRGGLPYISHPAAVVKILLEMGYKPETHPELFAAAWCHDVLEDCNVTYEQLAAVIGTYAADIVVELTHDKSIMTKDEYIATFVHATPLACVLKLADRMHNCTSQPKNPKHYGEQSINLCDAIQANVQFDENPYNIDSRVKDQLSIKITGRALDLIAKS